MKKLVGIALALGLSFPAHAMDYLYHNYGSDQIVIEAIGEIGYDEDRDFRLWLDFASQYYGARRPVAIVFNSPGGNVFGALHLGETIAGHHWNTGVSHHGQCASACVLAWAAGAHKSAAPDAKIGVHRPTADGRELLDPDAAAATTKTALGTAELLKATGAPESVVEAALLTPSSDMHWLTDEELAGWNVRVTW